MDLLIDPKPGVDSIVILDDPELEDGKKIYKNTRLWQLNGEGKDRLVDGIHTHHLIPTQFLELSTLPPQEDYYKSTAICIQRTGCEMYSIYKNEREYLGEILTLFGKLPFGHKAIVALKVFYGAPRNSRNYWKYACDLFTGQIVIVLASMELRELFYRELVDKCLADNKNNCILKVPKQGVHADREYTLGSTRFRNQIWEFRDQFVPGSHGELLDEREYSRTYRESMGGV